MKVRNFVKILASCTAILTSGLLLADVILSQEVPDDPHRNRGFNLVQGEDDRGYLHKRDYPWRAIGRLDLPSGGHCTGTLVGEDLVLTNAHCVENSAGKLIKGIRFRPNLIDNRSEYNIGVSHVWWGDPGTSDDWAIIRLRSPIGSRVGYFGYRTPSANILSSTGWQDRLILAGYSGDKYSKTPGVHYGCSIINGFNHTCDTHYGASGSAIFGFFNGDPSIVALHWGNNGAGRPNNYTPPARYTELITKLRNNNEGKPNRTYVQLCNRSDHDNIYSAIAYYEAPGWRSEGWYKLEKGTCREVKIPVDRPYNGDIFLHAKIGSITWGSGKNRFCVRRGSKFTILNADRNCSGSTNDEYAQFGKAFGVRANQLNTWNFNR
ncbi:MAG: DUF1036 domain-containing protein [Hormoscilla sp.]